MKKIIPYFIIVLILSFLGLYFAYSNGYYELKQSEKVSLTNQKIEEFESDILEGVDVNLENYLKKDNTYQTKTSEFSLKASEKFENIIDSGIKFIFRKISNLVE